ncbi:MAG: S-adenosylmethionine:tRNA ribosyltransferase-isomerase [Bacteroidota bacterium]
MCVKKAINISDFDYNLLTEKIAKYPLEKRDQSKLLIFKNGQIRNDIFKNISSHIPENNLLVFNNTRVIQARLMFRKATGAEIEIFCLEPLKPSDYKDVFNQKESCVWRCMIGNLKKWKNNLLQTSFSIDNCTLVLNAEKIKTYRNYVDVLFTWDDSKFTFGDILENAGLTPIPPYLNRNSESIDKQRYQTVYSKFNGSVAAPTAGLHFTDNVLASVKSKNIQSAELTLHVGAGTFRPVSEENVSDHEMHAEHFSVDLNTVNLLRKYNSRIISVGTTSLRTLESIYWTGIKILNGAKDITISQWEYQNSDTDTDISKSLDGLVDYMKKNNLKTLHNSTQIMIMPGYKFRMVNGLITNFHQPKSTLLLLVAAMIGKDWEKVYNHALNNDYRFLSYGDSSIILPDIGN